MVYAGVDYEAIIRQVLVFLTNPLEHVPIAGLDCTNARRNASEPPASVALCQLCIDRVPCYAQAEKEADVILWDGGNNDTPFYKPGMHADWESRQRVVEVIEYRVASRLLSQTSG